MEIENLKLDEDGYLLISETERSWIRKEHIIGLSEESDNQHYKELSKRGKVYTFNNGEFTVLSGREGWLAINEDGYGAGLYVYMLN